MPTISSVALGGLQVVALLAAVVVAGSRLLIAGLNPKSGSKRKDDWLIRVIAYGAIISLLMLFLASIMFVVGLMSAYGMPPLIDLAFISLLVGLAAFGLPMLLLIYYKQEQNSLPSIEPPQ